jgi:hypothetical protein
VLYLMGDEPQGGRGEIREASCGSAA